jgi:hypothetical protein
MVITCTNQELAEQLNIKNTKKNGKSFQNSPDNPFFKALVHCIGPEICDFFEFKQAVWKAQGFAPLGTKKSMQNFVLSLVNITKSTINCEI